MSVSLSISRRYILQQRSVKKTLKVFPKPCKHADDETYHSNSPFVFSTPPPPGTISIWSAGEWGNHWIKSNLANSVSTNITADLLNVHHGRLGKNWCLGSYRGRRARRGLVELLAAGVEWLTCDELTGLGRWEMLQRFITASSSCVVLHSGAFPPKSSPRAIPAPTCLCLLKLSSKVEYFQGLEV